MEASVVLPVVKKMEIAMKHALYAAVIILLPAAALATEAEELATYTYTGTVTEVQQPGSDNVQVGQQVQITLTVNYGDNLTKVNTARTDATHQGGFGYHEYPLFLDGAILGHSIANGFSDLFEIQRNYNGQYGYLISEGVPMGDSFHLDFVTTKPGIVKGFAIPQVITPSDFKSATFSYSNPEESFSGTINP